MRFIVQTPGRTSPKTATHAFVSACFPLASLLVIEEIFHFPLRVTSPVNTHGCFPPGFFRPIDGQLVMLAADCFHSFDSLGRLFGFLTYRLPKRRLGLLECRHGHGSRVAVLPDKVYIVRAVVRSQVSRSQELFWHTCTCRLAL